MKNRAIIIGGGASLKGFDFNSLRNKGYIIAVNKAISNVPFCDCFITCDYTFFNKIDFNYIKEFQNKRIFVLNSFLDYISYNGRYYVDNKNKITYTLLDYFDQIILAKGDIGLGYDYDNFYSGINSGYCAFQLAVIMGFEEIYLLGIDLTIVKESHYHNFYFVNKKQFQKKLDLFLHRWKYGINKLKKDKPNIKIYSCSNISKLNNLIPYKPFDILGVYMV